MGVNSPGGSLERLLAGAAAKGLPASSPTSRSMLSTECERHILNLDDIFKEIKEINFVAKPGYVAVHTRLHLIAGKLAGRSCMHAKSRSGILPP